MFQWVLWFHLISLVSWMSALFYLPRLFVHHAENREKVEFTTVIKMMQKKLYNIIAMPAMIATVISGALLAYLYPTNIFSTGGWFHVKLLFVAILLVYHFSLGKFRVDLENDSCTKSGKFFRMYNEVPTLLMMVIVAMVVIKPF